MVHKKVREIIAGEMSVIREAGLYKEERVIETPQGARIRARGKSVLNFCANNYLGLANHPDIIKAAQEGLKTHGYGMASVRFICGTQDMHKLLEKRISAFMKKEDTILYSSCFDANTGLFETILGKDDAVISDQLNHASVIDGIRLCKAERYVYQHADMNDLRQKLTEAKNARLRMIATDGVFSMDGDMAKLNEITELAGEFDALVMVDDSHATGFIGPNGRGTAEEHGVMNRIDVTTSTMGKALGGASGGFTAGRSEIIEFLRQRSRPYLFSNSIAPPIVAASIKALEIIEQSGDLRKRLMENTMLFRKRIKELGFNIKEGKHPIVPVMLGDAKLARNMADEMLKQGIYVIGFSYPVVPKGEARIRVQLSAAHSQKDVEQALSAFEKVGKRMKVI